MVALESVGPPGLDKLGRSNLGPSGPSYSYDTDFLGIVRVGGRIRNVAATATANKAGARISGKPYDGPPGLMIDRALL